MKLLAAFGLLAIALAASSRQWEERSFNKGNTYEFEWKGQIVSGVPVKGSSSHSLQQIHSKVFITVNEKHSILRLDNVKLTNGHKQLTEPRIISEVSLEESQLTSEQREQIKLPIRFRYHQGIISEIVFSEEESAWSENIKRSILNMLQVQMSPRKTQEEYNTKTVSNNKFFTVTERTLEGECEVAYTIVESEKNREEKEITKSLNFEKCPKRIDIRYGPRYSAECSMCEATDARPESQTVISYKVRGEDEERFLITEVELKSEYVFSPFSKDQEMLATYVHQKMRLVNIKSAERVEEPRNGKKSSLLYNYEMELAREKFWMNGDEQSYTLTGFAGVPKKELMDKYIRLTLASMEESEKDGVTLETNHNFARIVEVFRMCTEREVQEIHRHFWETEVYAEKIEKVREFLTDALIAAGTKVTIEHFVEKCEKKEISPIRAAIVIKGLVNTRVPSENIVNSLLRLVKSKVCREEPILRQSVLLTTGALMNGVCSKKEITKESWAIEIEGEKECRRELKTEWLKEWETLFESATSRYEKVLVLKAVANSALDVSIHFLEKVIYDRRQPLVVRQAAVDSLRMLRDQMPRKVQSVCLPLFKSLREPVPLRVSALYQLVHSRPERSLLDQIVHQLNIEPSTQLRSFGVSLLRSFSESKKNPCETKLAEDINVSLRMLRSPPLSTSTHVHLPWYSRLFDFGMTMDVASVFSNESVLPHELLASVDSVFAGQWNKHLVQVGLFQNNLDQVLIPLLKKLEKTETEIVLRGQRSSSKAPLREALKELVRQMKIQSRQNENGEDAFGMLYIRYKNLDYAVLPVEEQLIEKIVRSDSSISSSEMIRKIAKGFRFEGVLSGYVYEHVRIVPTTLGLPLQVTSKLPTVAHIKAHIKAEISPKMSLRVEMEPSFVSTHVTEMTVFSPEMDIGSRVFHSIQSTLPIHGQVEYNDEKQQLKAVLRLPKEEKRVLLVESRPTTFVRSFNNKQVPVLEEKTIRIPSFEKTSVHYEKSYGEEHFGLRTEVIGSVHRHVFDKKTPESILFGENHVQIVLVPTAESVKEIVLEVEPKYTKMASSEYESPRYDEIFTEKEFGLETSDESEERADERVSRRTHSKKHYESMKSLKGHEGRVNFRLYTIGGPKTIKGEMSVKGSCDEEIKVCRFDLQCKRSPLLEKERRDWELQMSGELVFPESPKTIKELKEMRHKEVEGTLKCRWGSEDKNEMTIRLQKTQSQEMARFVKEIDYESNKGLEKYDMLREASKLNKYVVLVDKDLSKDNELVFRRLFDLLKSEFYMSGQVESISSDSRRFKIEAVVEPEDCRRVNFTVECNGEKLIVKEAYSPIRIPLMSLGSRRVSLKGLNNKSSWASVFMPTSECEVSSNKVSTFDGLLYKTPLTTCYSVLAKDCSQEPEYVVMMKNMEKNSEEKKIKIVTQEKEIECELKQEKIVCKVDGRRVEDEEALYDMGIKLIGESSCEITIPKMTIRFDGYKVEIKADKRTENTQCGLCGHFDGRRDNEFRRADNEETEDIEEFHRSWLRRDNECEVEESKLKEKKNYGVESDEEERYDSEESFWNPRQDFEEENMGEKRSRKMLKKNLKKHISRKNIRNEEENTYEPENEIVMVEREGKTCFSMEEQPKCQPGDELIETENRKVKLACLPRSDRRTRRIVNGLKRGEESIMEEIRSLPMSLTDRIELPKLCRVY